MPAVDGAALEIRRSKGSISKGEDGFAETLQISWFGSGCHLFQLGELSVLTDPFVTNGFKIARLYSNPEVVAKTLGRIAPPDAVLVNHSHFDHLLDGHAVMSLPEWRQAKVPLFGGLTCKNLLAGWQDQEVLDRCRVIPEAGGAVTEFGLGSGYHLKVTAFESEHTPHLHCGTTLADGKIRNPRSSRPNKIYHYKAGEVFNFLVEMSGPSGSSFRTFCLAAPNDLDELPLSVPENLAPVDVAVITTPGAKNVNDYPQKHLGRLRARHVILSHFNNCLEDEPEEQLSVFGFDLARVGELSAEIQKMFASHDSAYPEFEALHLPAITTMREDGRARNVIHIRK